MNRPTLSLILAAFGLVAVLLGAYALYNAQRERQWTTPVAEITPAGTPDPAFIPYAPRGRQLVDERGKGAAALALTVPPDCGEQLLEFTGWKDAADSPYSWLRIEALADGREMSTTGPTTTVNPTDGAVLWALPAGDYTLTIGGENVRWIVDLTCR